jgi:uncharacterized membrane protein
MVMSLGIILLVLASLAILFGLAQQVLDRLYLNDKQALLVIGAIVAGSFINIPLYRGTPAVSINLGGAVIPLILALYVLFKAGTKEERGHGVLATVITGLVLFAVTKIYDFDTDAGFLDPQYIWGILAGGIAYAIGRSRRLAFIGGVLGIILVDISHMIEAFIRGIPSPTRIGGGGIFDTVIIAAIIGVLLAEIFGEARERLQGGTAENRDYPPGLDDYRKKDGSDKQ